MRRLGGVVIIVGNILFGRITVQFVREVLGRLTVVIQEQEEEQIGSLIWFHLALHVTEKKGSKQVVSLVHSDFGPKISLKGVG